MAVGVRNWFARGRAVEATDEQLAATGAGGGGGGYGVDPIDGDRGYTRLGGGGFEQPRWTTDRARAYSLAAYRSNPMARATIDTYTSFCVGDSGVSVQSDDAMVRAVLMEWWNDPRNNLGQLQRLFFQDWMLTGENIWEYMVGEQTGVVRFSPISPTRVTDVNLEAGNPLWFDTLKLSGIVTPLPVARIDDSTGLRTGQVGYFPSWRALITDRRGTPFLSPVLDDLDAYSQVLSNLVDRTALSRYFVWDVTVDGDQADVDKFIAARQGLDAPQSATVEVHNQKVKWETKVADTGASEDTTTAASMLTNVAAGSGLAKTWLADPDGANRATSMSMAEPVRRRIGGVQNEWIHILGEHARYVVDQAVHVGRLPMFVESTDESGNKIMVTPASLVRVAGPEIAAADSQVTAAVMVNLATAIDSMVTSQVMTVEAGALAVEKAWEQFVGRPFPKNFAANGSVKLGPDSSAEEIATAQTEGRLFLLQTSGGPS